MSQPPKSEQLSAELTYIRVSIDPQFYLKRGPVAQFTAFILYSRYMSRRASAMGSS